MHIGDRIRSIRGNKSRSAFGAEFGFNRNTIERYEKGVNPPNADFLEAICLKYRVSASWLLLGKEGNETGGSTEPGFTLVPKVKARLNAGNGSLLTGDEITGRYAFKNDWIRQKGDPEQMVLLDVFGESMEPVIWDGDTVLVDQSQTEITPGRIYAVGIDDTVMVKYIETRPGHLVLKSANEKWNDIEVDIRGDQAESIRIVGRVIWWCREAR